MRYNKLVRDKIPDIIREKGEEAKIHTASDKEYQEKLLEKLREEAEEFIKSRTEEELADILEVLESIKRLNKFSDEKIDKIKAEKRAKRGGFEKRIILEES